MAAPAADLWPRWQAHDPDSEEVVDHAEWTQFLDKYLSASADGIHLMDYAGVTAGDRKRLQAYLETLQSLPVSTYSRDQQFAYWVNLYNARTVELILAHYPVDSIRDITYGWFSFGPWDEKLVKVEGEDLSLNDIEHRILRPIWQDNRIHYAVNCASMGCPNLAMKAYTAENTEELLEKGARDYINHPRGVSIANKEVTASKIYDWYLVDFGDSRKSLVKHWLRYATPALRQQLESLEDDADWDYRYDWSLNKATGS
ncbi:MAG: DUF547 domain-containing protein [Ketobacteraceae bacterium]|nr:DUF547 domain-containing protein [Ketobacteraceae bacterium]